MKTTGIILAGGESSRMNFIDKGLIEISGKPCVFHVIEALKPTVDSIIIISNNTDYEQFGYDVYPDYYLKKGPMGGIFSGLSRSTTETNLFVACDMPMLSSEVFSKILKQSDSAEVIVPIINNRYQPLCAIYKKSILNKVNQSILADKLKLRFLIDESDSLLLDDSLFNEELFFNVNTPKELEHIKLSAS